MRRVLIVALLTAWVVTDYVSGAPINKLHERLAGAPSATRLAEFARTNRLTVIHNKILVEIFLADTTALTLKRMAKYGIRKDKSYGRINNRLQALVPADKLISLSEDKHVNWVQPPGAPHVHHDDTVK